MKRFSLIFCLVLALSMAFVGSAFANFGPHGGYATDTDACAGCHRAHTSFSTVEFAHSSGAPATEFALLVGNASTIQEFCYACHGDQAPGASTNVQSGIFDGAASTAKLTSNGSLVATDATHPYQTESVFNMPLNGGGFTQAALDWNWETSATPVYQAVSSSHNMEKTNVLWGAGNGANVTMSLTCVSCHDPHGSSNYRLLKDQITTNSTVHTVGGYTALGDPNAYVLSAETGYPITDGGFKKGENGGAAQVAAYRPDYTGGTKVVADISGTSLSAWCAACHEGYDNRSSSKNYGTYEATVGAQTRHRHAVDIPLTAGDSIIYTKAQENGIDARIPLEINEAHAIAGDYTSMTLSEVRAQNTLGCLTCHVAHGSSQVMTGWAAAKLVSTGTTWTPEMDGVAGVNPDKLDTVGSPGTSSLLRADNRGVCQRCHHK